MPTWTERFRQLSDEYEQADRNQDEEEKRRVFDATVQFFGLYKEAMKAADTKYLPHDSQMPADRSQS